MIRQVRILLNGDLFGCTDRPERLVAKLRTLRRQGVLNIYTSISWLIDRQEILLHTEAGRMCRPLFIVEQNQLKITQDDFEKLARGQKHWSDIIREGKIEYIDVQEEDTIMCAMSHQDLLANKLSNSVFLRYTHCEINPTMLLGAVVCAVPFAGHNQGPRVVYSAAQMKQSLGTYTTNYRDRMDNPGQILRYPQIPLISTRPSRYVHIREDSLIFNQSAIDRGLFNSVYYKTYKDSEKKNQASLEEERFCKPVKYNPNGTLRTAGVKGSYDLLDTNGFVKVGSYVKSGDVIIGKVVPLKNTTETGPKFKDASAVVSENTAGVVDWVYVNRDSDGYQFAKVRIRSKRVPGIGDKFSSRFGQKGTVGMIYRQEDMPFTKEAITPDLIVNPHAIPSRMTIGQLLECVMGKTCAIQGFEADATAFAGTDPELIAELLENAGFEKYGTEEMYNGRTGQKLRAKIFIGPTYYQIFKPISKDKIHARGIGPYQLLTRQPPEGRKRDGGFRFGEMERDCMLGYAVAGFLKERMFDSSDKYVFYVCKECGYIAKANPQKNIFECLYCPNSRSFAQLQFPYASKLFFQELMSLGISPRIRTD
jgi:DNA-directed RNA polymerase II subunit RPB2